MDVIVPIGVFLENEVLLPKYPQISISDNLVAKDVSRLTNQLWKLIPMREKEEDWQKQLDTLIIEITGLGELFYNTTSFLPMLSKLEGLIKVETTFEIYRKTVFECISLLQEILKDGK